MSAVVPALLAELERLGVRPAGVCADSRLVQAGDLFVAMPGHRVDGRQFAADAVARGAAAVVHEAGADLVLPVPALPVSGLAALAGEIAHQILGQPSERLWLVGITGTNGKTSVSQWIAQALGLLDCKCAVIGTLGNGYPGQTRDSLNTTPDAVSVHRLLAGFAAESAAACAMEVSSIGLDQQRVAGVAFDVAVFTNLTRDHLEYHGTMEAYGEAKARLFHWSGLKAAVVNLDDAFAARLAADLEGHVPVIGYTLEDRPGGDRNLAARKLSMSGAGIAFEVDGVPFAAPVVGRFNASNLLAVTGALLADGISLEDIAAVLGRVQPPPGRMQALGGDGRPLVGVD